MIKYMLNDKILVSFFSFLVLHVFLLLLARQKKKIGSEMQRIQIENGFAPTKLPPIIIGKGINADHYYYTDFIKYALDKENPELKLKYESSGFLVKFMLFGWFIFVVLLFIIHD